MEIAYIKAHARGDNLIILFGIRINSSKHRFARVKVDIYIDHKCVKSFYPVISSTKGSIFPLKCSVKLYNAEPGKRTLKVVLIGLGHFKGLSDTKRVVIDYDSSEEIHNSQKLTKDSIKKLRSGIIIIPKEVKMLLNEIEKKRRNELLLKRQE